MKALVWEFQKISVLSSLFSSPRMIFATEGQVLNNSMRFGDVFGADECVITAYSEDPNEEISRKTRNWISISREFNPKIRNQIFGDSRKFEIARLSDVKFFKLANKKKTYRKLERRVNKSIDEEAKDQCELT